MNFDPWIDKEYIDVKLAFFDNLDPIPLITRIIIENELEDFIEREFPITTSYNIFLTERKGLFLFHPLIWKLKHNGVSSIKLFKSEHDLEIKGLFIQKKVIFEEKEGCNGVILTDAIGQGNEIEELLELFKDSPIKKIIGYIAKKEGYEKLKAKYPTIEFIFLRPVENSEYLSEQKRLQPVYQSRMERIDEEHPLGKVKIDPTIPVDLLCDAIKSSIVPFYDGSINFSEDNLAITTLQGFTVTFWDATKIFNESFSIEPSHFELDRVQLRFRYCREKSCLSIMGLGLPNSCTTHIRFNLYRAILGRCHIKLPIRLCKALTPISKTPISRIQAFLYKRKSHPFCEIYCPYCVDLNVSQYLFVHFYDNFSKKLDSLNYKITMLDLFENCEK